MAFKKRRYPFQLPESKFPPPPFEPIVFRNILAAPPKHQPPLSLEDAHLFQKAIAALTSMQHTRAAIKETGALYFDIQFTARIIPDGIGDLIGYEKLNYNIKPVA